MRTLMRAMTLAIMLASAPVGMAAQRVPFDDPEPTEDDPMSDSDLGKLLKLIGAGVGLYAVWVSVGAFRTLRSKGKD